MATLTYTGTLRIEQCWCGIRHAIPEELYIEARDRGQRVYCPLGHVWVFGNTTQQELEKAQQKLADERRRVQATRELLAQEERSHAATRGHVTRKKKQLAKVRAGVCPVDGCHRHFTNLDRHIATKHPDYQP